MRSDDEDTEFEVEEKQGNGHEVGVAGGGPSKKNGLENGKLNGINGMNGNHPVGHDSYVDAVVEGKKTR